MWRRRLWDQATRRASELLSDDAVFALVQRGLLGSLIARRAFERQVLRVLSGANIPSQRDLDRLSGEIRLMNERLDQVVGRLEALRRKAEDSVAPTSRAVVHRRVKAQHE